MRILITGIGGMLGHDLARALKGSNQIFGIGRKKRSFKEKQAKYFFCDLLEPAALEKIVQKIRPQVVVHTAAKTQVDECELKPAEAYSNNVLATKFLIRSVMRYRPLFVYISTDYVFDGKKKSAYVENDSAHPLNVYGATKWLGEEVVRSSGLPYVIVRTSWLYGLNGPNFAATILRIARRGRDLNVVTDQKGSPTYTKDLALAIKEIIEAKNIRGILHVTNSGVTNWNEYAKWILKEAGVNHVKVNAIRTKDSDRPALRPKNSVLNNTRLKSRLGQPLRHWQEALRDYLKEMK